MLMTNSHSNQSNQGNEVDQNMEILRRRAPSKPLGAMIALALVATPASAAAKADDDNGDRRAKPKHVREYKQVRRDYVKSFGVEAAGRHIVRDGYREGDGDVRRARKPEIVRSMQHMRAQLDASPAQAAGDDSAAVGTSVQAAAAGAPTSVIECESGGDYGAVNPAGYYGAYQFDQGTWDAYAPAGYAGTNPAQAPPAVQDAAAASVPYDAWPNC